MYKEYFIDRSTEGQSASVVESCSLSVIV